MAKYDTRITASALGVDEPWLSSLLTRLPVAGVVRSRQGFRRQLNVEAVVCLAIARSLIFDLGLSAESAVARAHELLAAPAGRLRLGGDALEVSFDVAGTRRRVRMALDEAVARSTELRRGRPRSTPTRRISSL